MTSFSSFFDGRKCESCSEGVSHYDPNTGYNTECPSPPCPRESDNEYVAEQFNEWLDNVETKLSRDDYINMGVAMEATHVSNGSYTKGYVSWISFDGSQYSDMAEQFWNWVEANKMIFIADDYFEMGGAV